MPITFVSTPFSIAVNVARNAKCSSTKSEPGSYCNSALDGTTDSSWQPILNKRRRSASLTLTLLGPRMIHAVKLSSLHPNKVDIMVTVGNHVIQVQDDHLNRNYKIK